MRRSPWNSWGFWRIARRPDADGARRMVPVGRRRAKLMRRQFGAPARQTIRVAGPRVLDLEAPAISRAVIAALLVVLLMALALFLLTRHDLTSPFADAVGTPVHASAEGNR